MIDREREVQDEGNCGWVISGGEEACEEVRKRRVCSSPPGPLLVKAARLRTETSYKAGSVRRARPSVRSRPQSTDQVNDELVQRNITFLSGEICTGGMRAVVAPASRACPKPWNASVETVAGGAEVSRGHSTIATGDRKGRTVSNKEELRTNSVRGYYSDRSRPNRRALASQP